MKSFIHLESRQTSRYVLGYAHLDSWVPVCDALRSVPRVVESPDYQEASDGGTTALLVVITPSELAKAKNRYRRLSDQKKPTFTRWMNRAIEASLSGGGCGHEFDCCGCPSWYADSHRTKPREFSVRVHRSFNY